MNVVNQHDIQIRAQSQYITYHMNPSQSRQQHQVRRKHAQDERTDQKQIVIDADQLQQRKSVPIRWGYFFLFTYLYILMGALSGILGTMPYIYKDLPNISTMSLFNSVNFPFSLKFFVAPFLQKFSILQYGKRKTWIVVSLILGGLTILISGFYTDQNHSNLYAILGIVSQSWIVVLDISCHSMMIKQIKSANHNSIILGYGQAFGIFVGALLILKLTSEQFSESVGLSHPITSPQTLVLIFAIMMLVPIIIVHIFLSETTLQSEKKSDQFTFCEIISYYSTFLKTSSRYFRVCIFFLIQNQGFNFFNSLYDYYLVQRGFSRNVSNTLGYITTIPLVIATFYIQSWIKLFGGKMKSLMFTFTGLIVIDAYLIIFFPLQVWIITITGFLSGVLDCWRLFIVSMMINQFPAHALTGMYITVMASAANFGRLTTIQTEICGKFGGWDLWSAIGLGIQLIITIFMPQLFGWVQKGDSHVPPEIEEPDEDHQSNKIEYGNS